MTTQTTQTQQILTESSLDQFTGSQVIYRYPLFPGYRFTEGVKFMAETGGAFWLIDSIFAAQNKSSLLPYIPFQFWQLTFQTRVKADLLFRYGGHDGCMGVDQIKGLVVACPSDCMPASSISAVSQLNIRGNTA